jgi:hypothetical protein
VQHVQHVEHHVQQHVHHHAAPPTDFAATLAMMRAWSGNQEGRFCELLGRLGAKFSEVDAAVAALAAPPRGSVEDRVARLEAKHTAC